VVALIDYGIGNIRSVEKALRHLGAPVRITRDPDEIRRADRIVFPGVGAFGDGMEAVRRLGLEAPLREAIDAGTPFLGICLGMQLLFQVSEEMGEHQGLGIFPGRVVRFPDGMGLKVPQIGWNQLHRQRPHPLLEGVPDGAYVYFVHSYYCRPADPSLVLATTDYGLEYASVVGRGHVFGLQFHPEKSQAVGLRILRNFLTLPKDPL